MRLRNHWKTRCVLLAFVAAALFSLVLAGCGGGNSVQRLAAVDVSAPPASKNRAAGVSKGMQLILLSNWHVNSVSSLLNVFRSSPGLYKNGPPNIEFGFAPYIFTPAQDRYKNAEHMIDTLTNGGKNVTVTVHLDYHTPANSSGATIEANAVDFNGFLNRNINKKNLTICVCPSLEDDGSNTDFQNWTAKMAVKLTASYLPRIYLRRSPTKPGSMVANDKRFRGLQIEYHGQVNTQGDDYSNDGNYVYYPPAGETASSLWATIPALSIPC